MHILIVDSDPIQIQSLARGLKGRGHSVATATNREEAFTVIEQMGANLHLILTDLKIPHLDVFELARKARAQNQLFPLIIMTTFISTELQHKVRHEMNIALLEKPFGLEKLLHKVEGFELSPEYANRSM